ncbi:unnamed protein product [Linum tenue]|uniref:Disease resistance protein Roq1-like winged-helix domain-containing protein n=2 Tax=Linum tenue TaxID=586396 RepID=A0AAV0K8B4_9ROSI|nr:unnamed protein product [Linum tenue]
MKVLSTLNKNKCKLYGVGEMSPQLSLQLFCKHAFKKNAPPREYKVISKEIVSTTGGLPLTLKVVGSLLFREEIYIWKDKLAHLREMPEKEVVLRLRISYDALGYEAKQIFLDIVCFFIGMEKELPSYMWDDYKYHPASNINILIQRSMIKMGDDNEFQVHDQLRDMGREIVREENIEEPWMRSRVWQKHEGLNTLLDKKGSKKVKALRAYFSEMQAGYFEPEHFSDLSELRYFQSKNMNFKGDFTNLLPNLRWLRLKSEFIYDEYILKGDLRNLVILDLRSSVYFNCAFSEIKVSNKLKVLDLSGCYSISTLPKFPRTGSLEILNLSGCVMWESDSYPKLDISNLWNVKLLNLNEANLESIKGGTIGMMMKRLQKLDLTSLKCKNLQEVLVDIRELSSLKILRTIGASCKLWESEEEEEEEEEEIKEDVVELGKLPGSLELLATSSRVFNLSELLELEELTVTNCDFGLEIPTTEKSWWKVSRLKSLVLEETKIVIASKTNASIPESSLWLVCLPSSLTSIHIRHCPKMEWLPTLENLENLVELSIEYCPKMQEIRGLEGLKSLRSLNINDGYNMVCVHGFENLLHFNNLQTLEIQSCPHLAEALRDGDNDDNNHCRTTIHSLRTLKIWSCNSTLLQGGNRMPLLSMFSRLTTLELVSIKHYEDDEEDAINNVEQVTKKVEYTHFFTLNTLRMSHTNTHINVWCACRRRGSRNCGWKGSPTWKSWKEFYCLTCLQ